VDWGLGLHGSEQNTCEPWPSLVTAFNSLCSGVRNGEEMQTKTSLPLAKLLQSKNLSFLLCGLALHLNIFFKTKWNTVNHLVDLEGVNEQQACD